MGTVYEIGPHVVLRLSGDAALQLVHDTSTQDVAGLRPGSSAVTAFLTDKGRLLAVARVLAGAGSAVLVAEVSSHPGLQRAVVRPAPLASVEAHEEVIDALLVEDGDRLLDGLGFAVPQQKESWVESRDTLLVRDETGDQIVFGDLRRLLEALLGAGATRGDPSALEVRRIAAGLPRFGVDVDSDTHINETPLLEQVVSFTKGCYPGQESVARVRNLGHVRRMLRVLDTDGPVSRGDEVLLNGASVGRVTSAAGGRALALIAGEIGSGARVMVGARQGLVTSAGSEQLSSRERP
jgi:folate-binding protein YgfZ